MRSPSDIAIIMHLCWVTLPHVHTRRCKSAHIQRHVNVLLNTQAVGRQEGGARSTWEIHLAITVFTTVPGEVYQGRTGNGMCPSEKATWPGPPCPVGPFIGGVLTVRFIGLWGWRWMEEEKVTASRCSASIKCVHLSRCQSTFIFMVLKFDWTRMGFGDGTHCDSIKVVAVQKINIIRTIRNKYNQCPFNLAVFIQLLASL